MKRNGRLLMVGFCALVICLVFAMPAFAGDEVKIKGTIVAAPADPSGTLAPIAIQCEDGLYAVVNNTVAKKMAKFVGSKAKLTGLVKETEGKKVFTPWIFSRQK